MTSILKVDEIQNKAGSTSLAANKLPDMLSGSAKAWLNLDGTGTIAISDSFNIASVSDGGTGQYAVSFTNNMSNSSYVASGSTTAGSSTYSTLAIASLAQGSFTIFTSDGGSSQEDKDPVCVSVNGDLA